MTQSPQVELILKNGWYKTASAEELRIALMHVEQGAIDSMFNALVNKKNAHREDIFQSLADACDWP